jgi:hypothetical protein
MILCSKIFGIGLSRTGTKTLNTALTQLDIKSIHYPGNDETFRLLSNGVVRLPILEEYDGITDIHTVPFYPQLDATYPGSKFILTTRDVDAWCRSMEKHMSSLCLEDLNDSGPQWLRTAVYGIIRYDEAVMRQRFWTHNRAVTDYFMDRHNLLVMDITAGDGWDKLCPFLGKEVPTFTFPSNIQATRIVKQQWRARGKDCDLTS